MYKKIFQILFQVYSNYESKKDNNPCSNLYSIHKIKYNTKQKIKLLYKLGYQGNVKIPNFEIIKDKNGNWYTIGYLTEPFKFDIL